MTMVVEQADADVDHVADAEQNNDENEQDSEGEDEHGDDYEIEDEDFHEDWRCDVNYIGGLSDL